MDISRSIGQRSNLSVVFRHGSVMTLSLDFQKNGGGLKKELSVVLEMYQYQLIAEFHL